MMFRARLILTTMSFVIAASSGLPAVISPLLRGSKEASRRLVPHPSKSSSHRQSNYQGCLALSNYQLSQSWSFSGQAPDCSWVHTGSGGSTNGDSGSSGESGGKTGNTGGGSNGGSGEGSGNNGGGNGQNGDNGNGSGFDGSNGGTNDSDNGVNSDSDGGNDSVSNGDDGKVVSNEDISQGESDYDPMSDFDITVCGTYENLWLWDLSLSCNQSSYDADFGECNCTFAAELMDVGLLSCEDASNCPKNCPICSTCLSILGCTIQPDKPLISELVSSKLLIYLLAAAAAIVMLMLAAYYSRNRSRNRQDLKQSLMAEEKLVQLGKKIEMENCMYITGDVPWKPPQISSESPRQEIQGINTMSTSSTSRFFDERIQPLSEASLLGERESSDSNEEEISASYGFPSYPIPQTSSALQVVDTTIAGGDDVVSPISSPGVSLAGHDTIEDIEGEHSALSKDTESATEEEGLKDDIENS